MSLNNYNIYKYKVYGLNINSEIEMRELQIRSHEEKSSIINITYGSMSNEIKEHIKLGKKANYRKKELWFHINNVATYYIANGDTIIVEPCENADMNVLKVYLMCSCLGFIMLQRDIVAIHGGTIVIDGKGVIFTGDRGAGKSTLTTSLRLKGYAFVSDDVAATYMDSVPMINPGFPHQKLCEDAMLKLGYDIEEYVSIPGDTQKKYMVPAHSTFFGNQVPLVSICEITVGNLEQVKIEEVKGKEKLDKIIKNIYRTEFIKYLGGVSPQYLKQCINIAQNIKFYKITRPANQFTVDEQIKLIEEKFINVNNRELELV